MKITTNYGGITVETGAGGDTVILHEAITGMSIVLLADEIDEVFEAIQKCLGEYRQRQAARADRRLLDDWNNGRGITKTSPMIIK